MPFRWDFARRGSPREDHAPTSGASFPTDVSSDTSTSRASLSDSNMSSFMHSHFGASAPPLSSNTPANGPASPQPDRSRARGGVGHLSAPQARGQEAVQTWLASGGGGEAAGALRLAQDRARRDLRRGPQTSANPEVRAWVADPYSAEAVAGILRARDRAAAAARSKDRDRPVRGRGATPVRAGPTERPRIAQLGAGASSSPATSPRGSLSSSMGPMFLSSEPPASRGNVKFGRPAVPLPSDIAPDYQPAIPKSAAQAHSVRVPQPKSKSQTRWQRDAQSQSQPEPEDDWRSDPWPFFHKDSSPGPPEGDYMAEAMFMAHHQRREVVRWGRVPCYKPQIVHQAEDAHPMPLFAKVETCTPEADEPTLKAHRRRLGTLPGDGRPGCTDSKPPCQTRDGSAPRVLTTRQTHGAGPSRAAPVRGARREKLLKRDGGKDDDEKGEDKEEDEWEAIDLRETAQAASSLQALDEKVRLITVPQRQPRVKQPTEKLLKTQVRALADDFREMVNAQERGGAPTAVDLSVPRDSTGCFSYRPDLGADSPWEVPQQMRAQADRLSSITGGIAWPVLAQPKPKLPPCLFQEAIVRWVKLRESEDDMELDLADGRASSPTLPEWSLRRPPTPATAPTPILSPRPPCPAIAEPEARPKALAELATARETVCEKPPSGEAPRQHALTDSPEDERERAPFHWDSPQVESRLALIRKALSLPSSAGFFHIQSLLAANPSIICGLTLGIALSPTSSGRGDGPAAPKRQGSPEAFALGLDVLGAISEIYWTSRSVRAQLARIAEGPSRGSADTTTGAVDDVATERREGVSGGPQPRFGWRPKPSGLRRCSGLPVAEVEMGEEWRREQQVPETD